MASKVNPYRSLNSPENDGDRKVLKQDHPSANSLKPIAVAHAGIAVLMLLGIWVLWNPGDWHEALPWGLLAASLLAIAIGLWKERSWAATMTLILHWPLSVVAGLAIFFCGLFCLLVPVTGLGIFNVMAAVGLVTAIAAECLAIWSIRVVSSWRKDTA